MAETNQVTKSNSQTHNSPLVLNVTHRVSREQQRFEISQLNCVVGSGEEATVRLDPADINSLQCEFVRNPSGIYVRQLGESVLVNGESLAEAWVNQGDTITLGMMEIEIVETGQGATGPASTVQAASSLTGNDQNASMNDDQGVASNTGSSARNAARPGLAECPTEFDTNQNLDDCDESQLDFVLRQMESLQKPPAEISGSTEMKDSTNQADENLPIQGPVENQNQDEDQAQWLNQLYEAAVDEDGPRTDSKISTGSGIKRLGF